MLKTLIEFKRIFEAMKLVLSSIAAIGMLALMSFKAYIAPSAKASQVTFEMDDASATGTFSNPKGTVKFNEADMSKSEIDICIKVKSIDTESPERDTHLKTADYFDAKQYPEIKFKSTSVSKNTSGGYTINGDFTMKDVTKKVSIDASIKEVDGKRYVMGELPINRVDYNIGKADDGVGLSLKAKLKYAL